jgi:glycogenin glucosyltransferase
MAAHFIGANKPWNRPKPNNVTSTSPSSRQVNGQFDDLLLRWHEAYEEYYPANRNKRGSAEVVHTERGVEVVERPYSVPTYRAVWEAESEIVGASSSESASSSTRKSQARIRGVRRGNSPASLIKGALQTDDLQEMFQDGLVAASIAAELASLSTDGNRSGEGVYIILPLDGRINLMGPDLDSGDEGDSPNSDDTVHASRGTSSSQDSQQMWSPPMVSWDPAREPPPKGEGNSEYQMKEPVDAYYVNAWDQHIQPKGKAAFYQTSSVPTSQTRTMEMLQREHYFDNLGSQRPDPSLVKAVFPWESNQSSATSSRIFPDEEPASTVPGSRGAEASLEAGSISPGEASSGSNTGTIDAPSSQTTPSAQRAFSPSSDYQKRVPPSLNYSNAWDRVSAIGAKYDRPKQPVSSNRGIQTTGDEARASRSSQTTSAKYRNRGSQAEVGDWEGGANIGRGLRDASADQSADGDNESSSDSEDEEGEEAGTGKWRREGPGPGYQRKAERHNEQSGVTPRSPRSQQYSTLGGASGGGSRISGDRSRSSSSSGGIPPALVVPGTVPSAATRQRLRAEGGLPFVEEGAVSPSLDMSLSTAYEQVSDSARWTSPHVSPPLLFSQSSFESGRSTPTALSTTTPSSTSRGDARKEARS